MVDLSIVLCIFTGGRVAIKNADTLATKKKTVGGWCMQSWIISQKMVILWWYIYTMVISWKWYYDIMILWYYLIIYDMLFPYCGNDTKWWYVSCLDIMAMGKKQKKKHFPTLWYYDAMLLAMASIAVQWNPSSNDVVRRHGKLFHKRPWYKWLEAQDLACHDQIGVESAEVYDQRKNTDDCWLVVDLPLWLIYCQ